MNIRTLVGCLAAGLLISACGPRVSVHFHDDENFNVTAYAADGQYTLAELQELSVDEARFVCQGDEPHSLGEQTCDLREGQLCYSAVFCCEPVAQAE